MVARAVMRAWITSLGGVTPPARIYRPAVDGAPGPSEAGEERPSGLIGGFRRRDDDAAGWHEEGEDDPRIRIAKRSDIVPRRPGASARPAPSDAGEQAEYGQDDSLWSSHLFWKGIVVGAAIVLLVKIAIDVRMPYGIDWFGF